MGLSNVVDRIKRKIDLSYIGCKLDTEQIDAVYGAILQVVGYAPIPGVHNTAPGEHLLYIIPIGKWRRTAWDLRLCVLEVEYDSSGGGDGSLELFFDLEEEKRSYTDDLCKHSRPKTIDVSDSVALIDQVAVAIHAALGLPEPFEYR